MTLLPSPMESLYVEFDLSSMSSLVDGVTLVTLARCDGNDTGERPAHSCGA